MSGAQHEPGCAASSVLDFGRYAPCATSDLAKINRRTSSKGEVDSKSAQLSFVQSAQFSSDIDTGNTLALPHVGYVLTVHPRMRGEHFRSSGTPARGFGSSPHARGTQRRFRGRAWDIRFIPACAGNTTGFAHSAARTPVHPRMRGEHLVIHAAIALPCGSSPHARGTLPRLLALKARARFIPACAGNTRCATSRPDRPSVHPRMRGEHPVCHVAPGSPFGSSPHARGTQLEAARVQAERRFIPACAGNTSDASRIASRWTVHPRMRGEHAQPDLSFHGVRGSSPHARGTRTSAYRRAPPLSVHPRMRGEHGAASSASSSSDGSSPHARGTRLSAPPSRGPLRFIPACAGNTSFHM